MQRRETDGTTPPTIALIALLTVQVCFYSTILTLICSECLVMKVHSVTHSYQSTVMLIITVCRYSPDPCSYNPTTVLSYLCVSSILSFSWFSSKSLSKDSQPWRFSCDGSIMLLQRSSRCRNLFKPSNLQVLKNWGVSCTPHWYHCTTKHHTTLC